MIEGVGAGPVVLDTDHSSPEVTCGPPGTQGGRVTHCVYCRRVLISTILISCDNLRSPPHILCAAQVYSSPARTNRHLPAKFQDIVSQGERGESIGTGRASGPGLSRSTFCCPDYLDLITRH